MFPQRWVSRGGPLNWPAKFLDLTTIDFLPYRNIKSLVYQTPATISGDMIRVETIREVFQNVTPTILINVKRNILNTLDKYLL